MTVYGTFLVILTQERIPSQDMTPDSFTATLKFVANCLYIKERSQPFGFIMLVMNKATHFMLHWTFLNMVGILQDLISIRILLDMVRIDATLVRFTLMTRQVHTMILTYMQKPFPSFHPTVVDWITSILLVANGCPTI